MNYVKARVEIILQNCYFFSQLFDYSSLCDKSKALSFVCYKQICFGADNCVMQLCPEFWKVGL